MVGDGSLPRGQWVCIETHIKNNTVGQANGLNKAWKDGAQGYASHAGIEMRKAGQPSENHHFSYNRLYRQDGGGRISYDRLAFGNTRIGCLGSVPTNNTTPPAPVVLP